MLDLKPVLEVTSLLTNKYSTVKSYGKSVFITCYRSSVVLACYGDETNVRLMPLTVRLTYSEPPRDWRDPHAALKSATVACVTRDPVAEIVGTPVFLYSREFEIYGRIRRSKTDRLYKQTTFSTYVSLYIQSLTSISQCRDCRMRPFGKECQAPSCHLSKATKGA